MTVELAAGVAPRDLIPGDPDELGRLASRLDVFAHGMSDAAIKLADVHAAGWTGPASDAFSGLVGEQPARYHKAGSAFGHAVSAIRGYATVLRHAQSDAGQAVSRFTDAHGRSESWQRAHAQHVTDVQAAAAAGEPPPAGPAPPATDPAAGDLAASRQLLVDAREAVRAQGQIAATALVAATDGAPEKPGLLDSVIGGIGDFVSGAGHVVSSVWHAAGGVLEDVGGFLVDFMEDFGADLLQIAAGALIMLAGGALITIGLGMEGGGLILDATGVGAVVGVPINIAGVAVITGGVVLIGGGAVVMMQGGSNLGDDIANHDSGGSGSGSGTPKPSGNANDNLGETADDFIAATRKGSINREFPGEMRGKTLGEIKADKSAAGKKAWKLLNDGRFKK